MINNHFYNDLEGKWYTAEDHPVALLRAENQMRIPWILKTLEKEKKREGSVLDIGCGGGFLTNTLALKGYKVTGIDLSESSLQIAKERDKTQSVNYQQADAYYIPFEAESFDAIFALDLLEHVEKPERVIKEASQVLKPGGLFFFYTFNRNWLSWITVIKGVEWFVANTPPRMHLYSLFIKPAELTAHCEKYQMDIHSIKGVVPQVDKAFWRMLWSRAVPSNFRFKFTNSLKVGYLGFAKKKEVDPFKLKYKSS